VPKKPQQLAKLSRPRLYDAVPRTRLFKLLDQKRKHAGIWIAGPPGAGKTTLVASYLEATGSSGLWFQVDAGDKDPATFFFYLGQAALGMQKARKLPPLPLFSAEYLADLEGFSRRYFRDLYARLPDDAIVVFDNCQEAGENVDFDRILVQALGEAPEGLTVVLISRVDPSATFSVCAVNQTLASLNWPELQLNLEEATAIAATKVKLDAARIRLALDQCDGWAAGLTLLFERSRQEDLPSQSPPDDYREGVFEYFASQILAQTPPSAQAALMRMALLPFTTPSLATAISGDETAGKVLEDLYRRHLFVDRRGRAPYRYQFHALFRDFLLERLRRSTTAHQRQRIAGLAGELLEREGFIEEASALYCEGADWGNAIRLVLAQAKTLLAQGRWKTLEGWIRALPQESLAGEPWLLYWLGLAQMQVQLSGSRETLVAAYKGFVVTSQPYGQLLSAASVLNTIAYEYDDFVRMDSWIKEIDLLLTTDAVFVDRDDELLVWSSLLLALRYRSPAHARLAQCVDRIDNLIEHETNANRKIAAAISLLNYCNVAADLDRAWPLIGRIGPLLANPDVSALNQAYWWLTLGYHHHISAATTECFAVLDRADRIASEHGLARAQVISGIYRIYCLTVMREIEAAERMLDKVSLLVDRARPMDLALISLGRYTTEYLRSNASASTRHAREGLTAARRTASISHHVIWQLLGASALALSGDTAESELWLDEAWQLCEGSHLRIYQPALLMSRASCALRDRELPRCHELLEGALRTARGTHADLFFRWTLGPVETLLAEALAAGIEVDYVRELIRRFGFKPPAGDLQSWPWPVRIFTLGEFSVHANGLPVRHSHKVPRKPLTLLKAMVALGAVAVPEKKLVDVLWPDLDGDAAMEAFRIALHRLRKLLGDTEIIQASDGVVNLNFSRCWLDVRAVEGAIRAAQVGSAPADGLEADRVLQLYRGHFLPGEEEAAWALSMRERLRAKFITHVARMGRKLEDTNQNDLAAEYYRRGIEADDLAEEFYQGLMRCHIQAGRNSEAMGVYRRLRQTLSVTLGITPSQSSERLFQGIQR